MEQSCFRTKWLMLRYLFFSLFFSTLQKELKELFLFWKEIIYSCGKYFKDIYNLDELLGDIVAG